MNGLRWLAFSLQESELVTLMIKHLKQPDREEKKPFRLCNH